jgi:hypothetical protein
MANQVLGKNVIVAMNISGIYYPIFCGKTAELPLEQDEIEVTHVNSGSSREYVPGMSNFIMNITGITVLDNTESRVSVLYLMQLAIRRSINTYRMLFTDQDGDTAAITFSAFIRNTIVSRDVTQWSQSSLTLRVTGDLTFSSIIPPPVVSECEQEPTIYTTLAEGAISVTDALLIPGVGETIIILHVSRSGLTYYETAGTPGNLEFLYTSGTGTITFQSTNPGNPAAPDLEPVSIEYKIES